jgi:hypothetical protein
LHNKVDVDDINMMDFGLKDLEVETSMRNTRGVDRSVMEGGGMEEEEARRGGGGDGEELGYGELMYGSEGQRGD